MLLKFKASMPLLANLTFRKGRLLVSEGSPTLTALKSVGGNLIKINNCQNAASVEHCTSMAKDGIQSNDATCNSSKYTSCGNSEQTVLVDVLPTVDMSNQSIIDTFITSDAEGVHLDNVSLSIACNTDASSLSDLNMEHNYAVLASEQQECEQVAITTCSLYNSFQSKVKDGPIYVVCTSCKQTFFRHSVQYAKPISKYKHNDIARMCFTDTVSANNEEWVCKTCSQAIHDGRIRSCSLINGLGFRPIPNELQLTQLEERLVSPWLAFMQLRELPRGGQYNIKGNVVNVPADVNLTVQQLPRMFDDNETIPVKFKPKLSYKHYVSFGNIRPNRVLQAAKWLVENSPLFQNEVIKVDESWLNNTEGVINAEYVTLYSNEEQVEQPRSSDVDHSRQNANRDSTDNWTEDDNFMNDPPEILIQYYSQWTSGKIVHLLDYFRIYILSFWHSQQSTVDNCGQTTLQGLYHYITAQFANGS